jgi:hypothetical protein
MISHANADDFAQELRPVAAYAITHGILDDTALSLSNDHISKDGFDSSFHSVSSLSGDINVVFT